MIGADAAWGINSSDSNTIQDVRKQLGNFKNATKDVLSNVEVSTMTMSVSKFTADTGEFVDLPIATSHVFANYWLRASQELDQPLVKLFDVLRPTKSDESQLLNEIHAVKQWAEKKTKDSTDPFFANVAERAEQLLRFIDAVDWEREQLNFG